MKDLIARLEKATGPDRELDVRIHLALFPDFGAKMNDEYVRFENVWNRNRADHQNHADNVADWWGVPRYTGSLDAAMTLLPERHRYLIDKRPYADDGRPGAYRVEVYKQAYPYLSDRSDAPTSWGIVVAATFTAACLKSRSLPADTEGKK